MTAKSERIALKADPGDPEDFDVSEEGLAQAHGSGANVGDVRQDRSRRRSSRSRCASIVTCSRAFVRTGRSGSRA